MQQDECKIEFIEEKMKQMPVFGYFFGFRECGACNGTN